MTGTLVFPVEMPWSDESYIAVVSLAIAVIGWAKMNTPMVRIKQKTSQRQWLKNNLDSSRSIKVFFPAGNIL